MSLTRISLQYMALTTNYLSLTKSNHLCRNSTYKVT